MPSHHTSSGRFSNPWLTDRPPGSALRWMWERWREPPPPNPLPSELPRREPDPARPRAPAGELCITWVGHATFLIQLGPSTVLTDPVFGRRASPVPWAGPARFVPPGLSLDELPPVDAVVLSHDHYDHLDRASVRELSKRFGDALRWFTPLGYRGWFERLGVHDVTELDWWEEAEAAAPGGRGLRVRALPAQHWTRRLPWERNRRLWASWSLRGPGGGTVYFGGDSGWFPGYREVGERAGPFDAVLLPVGAYEPRWFMQASHMDPDEAVRAYQELGGVGLFGAMHWGTFRLTDEDPLEPPVRVRTAWRARGLSEERLWVPAHGETRRLTVPEGPGGGEVPAPGGRG